MHTHNYDMSLTCKTFQQVTEVSESLKIPSDRTLFDNGSIMPTSFKMCQKKLN